MNYKEEYEKIKNNVDLALTNIDFLMKSYKDVFEEDTCIDIETVVKSYEYIADILNGKNFKELSEKYKLDK